MRGIDQEKLGLLLSAHRDGELSEREAALVAKILRQDESARRLLKELDQTAKSVAELPRHPAPPALADEIRANLERRELLEGSEGFPANAPRRGLWWGGGALAMAACLALLFLPLFWWSRTETRSPGSAAESTTASKTLLTESAKLADASSRLADLEGPNLEERLQSGAPARELLDHRFAREPVQLKVVLGGKAEQESVLQRVESQLASLSVPDLRMQSSAVTDASRKSVGPDVRFYLPGQPSVNFADEKSVQLLVRVPENELEPVLSTLGQAAPRSDQVAFRMNSKVSSGLASARDALVSRSGKHDSAALVLPEAEGAGFRAQPAKDETPGQEPASGPGAGPFAGLLKIVGLNGSSTAGERSPDATGRIENAGRLVERENNSTAGAYDKSKKMDQSTELSKAAADSPSSADSDAHVAAASSRASPPSGPELPSSEPAAVSGNAPVSLQRTSLVERMKRALDESTRKAGIEESKGTSAPRRARGIETRRRDFAEAASNASNSIPMRFVTLVIELAVEENKAEPSEVPPTKPSESPRSNGAPRPARSGSR